MSTLQIKRGTTSAVDAYLPVIGEPVYDTTLKQLSIGDGVTAGGVKVLRTLNFYQFGAVGDGVTDDSAAILAAIAFCKSNREYRLHQEGGIFATSATLPFNDSPSVISTTTPPLYFHMGCEIRYTGTNKAVAVQGNGWCWSVYIESLVGTGVFAEGIPGGGAENIGLWYGPNSGGNVKVGTIRNFTHNIMFDGAYFNNLEVDYSYQCFSPVTFRNNPTTGFAANRNKVVARVLGGPYADSAAGDFATRRLLTSARGVVMRDDAVANEVLAQGIEYCLREDDSFPIDLGPLTRQNIIHGHVEGGLATMVKDQGEGNILELDGGNSQRIDGNAMSVTGVGAEIGFIGRQHVDTQIALFSPHHGQGGMDFSPSTKINGPRFHRNAEKSYSAYSYTSRLPGTAAFVLSGAGTSSVTASSVDFPSDISVPGGHQSYILETTTASNRWFTVGPSSLLGDTPTDLMFGAYLRGITGQVKVSIFILDQAGVYITEYNTELSSTSPWQQIRFPIKRGSATGITYRIAIRDFVGSGGSIGLYLPTLSANLGSMISYFGADGYLGHKTIEGSVLPDATRQMYGMVPFVTTAGVVATALTVRGRAVVEIDSTAGGTTINQFTSVTEGQLFKVLNISGATITVSSGAHAAGGTLSILNNTSMDFLSRGGLVYRLGDIGAQTFSNLTLQNSWVVVGGRRAVYRKVTDSVQIEMQIINGTATDGTLLATLPVGFRPAFPITIPVVSGPNATPSSTVNGPRVNIATDGQITCVNCSSVTGIFFVTTVPLV